MQTTKECNPHPRIVPRVCTSQTGWIFWGVGRSLVCRGCGNAKEGLRFCSLEVVDEEAWIDPVQEESKAQYSSQKTCKIWTTSVKLFLQLQRLSVILNMQNNWSWGVRQREIVLHCVASAHSVQFPRIPMYNIDKCGKQNLKISLINLSSIFKIMGVRTWQFAKLWNSGSTQTSCIFWGGGGGIKHYFPTSRVLAFGQV